MAAEGVSVLVSTHYMDEAEYCNRIALIDQGRLIALGGPAELKARSLDDDLLLIECDKLGAALTALHEIPDILDAAVFGSAIHVRVPHAELAETSCPMRLAAQGIAVERIERIEPSLEDVFVHHGGRQRQGAEPGLMNFGRVRALAVKELLQVVRDPRSLIIALLMPILQMLLLGYGLNLDVKHIPTCTFDREGSQSSRDMLDHFQASQYFDRQTAPAHLSGTHRGNRRQHVPAGDGDSARLYGTAQRAGRRRRSRRLSMLPTTNQANIAMGYARSVVAGFANDLQVQALGRQGMTLPVRPVGLEPRVWFNEDLESRNFIIPGVVALVLALIGAQLTSLTISREWERGTMELLISTPVTPMEVLIGKLVPYFVVGLLDATICISFATLWFHVPFRGTLGALFFTTSLFLIVVLGIGYLFSVAIRSRSARARSPLSSPCYRRCCCRA